MIHQVSSNGLAELPLVIVCEGCGHLAHVPPQSIDEDARPGQLRGFDQTWRAGLWFTLICPTCGRRKQRVPEYRQIHGEASRPLHPVKNEMENDNSGGATRPPLHRLCRPMPFVARCASDRKTP
jgi:hypothetical protein